MCETAVLENPGMLKYVPDPCKTQEMRERAAE